MTFPHLQFLKALGFYEWLASLSFTFDLDVLLWYKIFQKTEDTGT